MRLHDFINESQVDEFILTERKFSNNNKLLSVGLANIHAKVTGDPQDIEYNKDKIARAVKILKKRGANMIIFPEFCLAGYFWENESECWPYMDKGVTDLHLDWVKESLEGELDDTLQFIFFNNIRRSPGREKKYLNSTYMVNKKVKWFDERYIYDKTFLPGIENTYTISGKTDRMVIDTQWGRFGFSTCYDWCFSQIYQEMAMVDKVDAVIQMASWRGGSTRDYPGMNVDTDNYYGELWDMLMDGTAARNQMWVISANAVGRHGVNNARFWGGSGLWAPSGLKLSQASHTNDELLLVHNIDIIGEKKFEKDDFNYSTDFDKIYDIIDGKRTFTRL